MKPISRISLLLLTLVMLMAAFPSPALAQSTDGDEGKFVFGGTYTLRSGETLRGGLVVVGGTALLEEDTLVIGDIVVVGGQVEIFGEVEGNVIAIGGRAYLGKHAVVNEDLVTVGGTVQREEGALVRGSITAEMPEDFDFGVFSPQAFARNQDWRSNLWRGFKPIGDVMVKFMQALALSALAAVLALFLLKPMNRVSRAVITQPFAAGGLGFLTIIVLPALLVVLAITLILLPLSLIGVVVLVCGFVFGWVSIGLEVGKRIEKMFKVEDPWVPAVSAGVGTLTLSVVSYSVGLIPCIGWVLPFLVYVLGLGAVVLTLFGSRDYPLAIAPARPAISSDVAPAPTPYQPQSGLDAMLEEAAAEAKSVNRVDDLPSDDGEIAE